MVTRKESTLKDPYLFYSFDNEDAYDSGPFGLHGKAAGNPAFGEKTDGEKGPSGKYLVVDKRNYYSVPIRGLHIRDCAFSVSLWARFTEDVPLDQEIIFIQTGIYLGEMSPGFYLAAKKTDDMTVFGIGVGSEFEAKNSKTWLDPTTSIFDGEWHLITAVYDQPKGKYTVTVDAEHSVDCSVGKTGFTAAANNASYMGLGLFVWDDYPVKTAEPQKNGTMQIDDLGIYKRALTIEEIKAYYEAPTETKEITVLGNCGGTYYVDSENGSDENDGKTPESAFKTLDRINSMEFIPGASVLFKKGCIFEGQLKLTSKGSEESPIIISSYGEGDFKPIISGNGVLPGTVHLLNAEYIEIDGLEITNRADKADRRSGLYIEAKNSGVLHNITVKNCSIHDVDGDNYNSNMGFYRLTGGIILFPNGLETPSSFDGLLIENNTLERCDHSGILLYSAWCNRLGITEGYGKWTGSTNVVIRGNYLNNIGGDGIQIGTSDGTLVEHNTVYYANNTSGKNRCGIWPWNSDNCIYQYNEVAYTQLVEGDGQGLDLDFGTKNNIMQYNYSHDNEGGFLLVCSYQGVTNVDNVFRYNISVNDEGPIYRVVGVGTEGCKIYNNLVYNDNLTRVQWLLTTAPWEGDVKETYFYNNIFYSAYGADWSINDKTYLKNNCFYAKDGMKFKYGENNINSNPLFSGRVDGTKVKDLLEFALSPDSPCINAGFDLSKIIMNNLAEVDYFGNVVDGQPDIGPIEKVK